MRASPPVLQKIFSGPDYADLSKPAKERIALAARRLFMMYGIYISLREIAELAETNEATAIQYYQSHSNLVQVYVQELIGENETHWTRTAAEHPNDPEAQLRSWIERIELRCGDAFDEVCALPRAGGAAFPILVLRRC